MNGAHRAVLFDLDGTLIDSAPDLGAAANALRVARGLLPLPLTAYRPMAGAGARGMLKVAFDLGPDHADYEHLKAEFLDCYEQRLTASTAPFPGVPELLTAIESAGMAWGIVTNKIERFALPLAAALSPLRGAGVVIGGDTTAHPKPHPAPLLEATRRLGVEPSACVYVGDDERDMVAGRAAGMVTVAAEWGYLGMDRAGRGADPRHWPADAIVSTPAGLHDWLLARC